MIYERLATIATAITVTIMFSAVVWLAPFVRQLSIQNALLINAASALAAVAIYRSLADALLWLFKRSLWLRRLLLGKSFIEGTWAGYYSVCSEHRLTLEFIDQSIGEVVVHGREFSSDGQARANWSSDCAVFHTKHLQQGLGVFRLVYENGRYANKLDGYAVDLVDGNRDPNVELKLSDRPVPDTDALARARTIFGVPGT